MFQALLQDICMYQLFYSPPLPIGHVHLTSSLLEVQGNDAQRRTCLRFHSWEVADVSSLAASVMVSQYLPHHAVAYGGLPIHWPMSVLAWGLPAVGQRCSSCNSSIKRTRWMIHDTTTQTLKKQNQGFCGQTGLSRAPASPKPNHVTLAVAIHSLRTLISSL